jgi:hypothetical protein
MVQQTRGIRLKLSEVEPGKNVTDLVVRIVSVAPPHANWKKDPTH